MAKTDKHHDKEKDGEKDTEFINLQTDFGFKRAFGTPRFKECLILLLNALLGDKLKVKDVSYHNKEIDPEEEEGKRIVFDVYCTSPVGAESGFLSERQRKLIGDRGTVDHHFIVEMQNVYAAPFEERIIYYESRMITDQGKEGWDYELMPALTIAVIDFHLPGTTPQLIGDYSFRDRATGHELSEKVRILFASLASVAKEWKDCKTGIERILFLIKNMDTMTTTSPAYAEGQYKEFFKAAKRTSLKEGEYKLYSQSLAKMREMQRGIEYAAEVAAKKAAAEAAEKAKAQGRAEGRAEGRAKGRAEGRAEGVADMVLSMYVNQLPVSQIAKIARITEDEVIKIVNKVR